MMPPLVIALKKFNTDPDVWSVPKRGTYRHDFLMKLVQENKKPKARKEVKAKASPLASYTAESQNDRIMRILREAEMAVRR